MKGCFRGGSWTSRPQYARVADRYWFTPVIRLYDLGLRLAKTPGQRMAP